MRNWSAQRVLIIGVARQGLALARYLATQGAQVVLTDQRPAADLEVERTELADLPLEWALGGHPLSLLDDVDMVCPSGGVPLTIPIIVAAQERGIQLSNDSQIFLEVAPCKVIGITGSAGKTTTTTLVGRMVSAAIGVEKTWVGGNIGHPLIANVAEMEADHFAVMELSSFQLEIMTRAPQVAAILNITPNHLDRHKTMAAYTNAKAQILQPQTTGDIAVLGRDDPGAWALAESVQGDLITFGWEAPPKSQVGTFISDESISWWDGSVVETLLSKKEIQLPGEHNVLNVLAAAAIVKAAGLSAGTRTGVTGFTGVEHRLEFVADRQGAAWYNDSIATAPERAMASMRSFDEPVVLLAGGRDKDLPWDEFAAFVSNRVDHLILFGEARSVIAAALERSGSKDYRFTLEKCGGLQAAVQAAARVVQSGDIVLLSPGGTSFDEFNDFAERGEWFKTWVKELP
jgi:UDP-N-acetylmuramoylalanine--D-glutamate ligase